MPDYMDAPATPDIPVVATPTLSPDMVETLRRNPHVMRIFNGPIQTQATFNPDKTDVKYFAGNKEIADPYRSRTEIASGLTPATLPSTSALDLEKVFGREGSERMLGQINAQQAKTQEVSAPLNAQMEKDLAATRGRTDLNASQLADEEKKIRQTYSGLITKMGGQGEPQTPGRGPGQTFTGGAPAPSPSPTTKAKITAGEPATDDLLDAALSARVAGPQGPIDKVRDPGDFIKTLSELYGPDFIAKNFEKIRSFMSKDKSGGIKLWGPDVLRQFVGQTTFPVPGFMKSRGREGYDLFMKQLEKRQPVRYEWSPAGIDTGLDYYDPWEK